MAIGRAVPYIRQWLFLFKRYYYGETRKGVY